jgi:hypothetical protein
MQRDYTVDAPDIALTAGTALYMANIKTASTCPVDVIGIKICGDSQVAGSLKVETVTATSDGTGTAYTPKAYNGDGQLVACTTTAKINYTVAPTGTITVFETFDEYVPTGPFELLLPLGRELTIPVSTLWYVRFTSTTASFNGYATLLFEE